MKIDQSRFNMIYNIKYMYMLGYSFAKYGRYEHVLSDQWHVWLLWPGGRQDPIHGRQDHRGLDDVLLSRVCRVSPRHRQGPTEVVRAQIQVLPGSAVQSQYPVVR